MAERDVTPMKELLAQASDAVKNEKLKNTRVRRSAGESVKIFLATRFKKPRERLVDRAKEGHPEVKIVYSPPDKQKKHAGGFFYQV